MAEEWPIAAPQPERAAGPARGAGADRLHVVMADFFLDPQQRLTEQERALMSFMLADLLEAMADEVRSALPGLGGSNDGDGRALAKVLAGAGLLDHPRLIALLLRRADEERIATAVRARAANRPIFLQSLIAAPEAAVSAAAMDLILARGRRRDSLGQLRLEFDDVPADVAAPLCYAVAAALRSEVLHRSAPERIDRELADAASALLARHDEGRSVDSVMTTLVRALAASGMLDEHLLATATGEGDLAFLAEALAQLAGLEVSVAWDHLFAGGDGRAVLLFKMAGLSRSFTAGALVQLGELIEIGDPVREIERFESLELQRVWQEQERLRLDASYASALAAIESGRG